MYCSLKRVTTSKRKSPFLTTTADSMVCRRPKQQRNNKSTIIQNTCLSTVKDQTLTQSFADGSKIMNDLCIQNGFVTQDVKKMQANIRQMRWKKPFFFKEKGNPIVTELIDTAPQSKRSQLQIGHCKLWQKKRKKNTKLTTIWYCDNTQKWLRNHVKCIRF